MIRAGQFRHYLELQSVTRVPDENGARVDTWTTYARAWARIEGISAREIERAKSFGNNTSLKVTIRYRPGISAKDQIKFGTRRFLINGILNPEEANVTLELYCSEVG